MQLFVLALVIGIFAHDSYPAPPRDIAAGMLWLIVLAPKLLLVGLYWLHCVHVRRSLGLPAGLTALRRLQSASVAYRWLLIVSFGQDLYFGALANWRERVDDLVLVDELAVMTPPILALIAMWWAYYPIDRRVREAALMRDLDEGRPIHRIWSLREYLLANIRHQIAFMLAPLMLIMAWSELVNLKWTEQLLTRMEMTTLLEWRQAAVLVGVGVVFLLAPVLIRLIWDTVPMPPGELREQLTAMCRRHRIGVRQLLVWRTYGAMINAAVIGVIAPLRYILMTDALLDSLSAKHVEAVMAHEIAHVKRHHMFWLMASASSMLLGLEWLWTGTAALAGNQLAEASIGGFAFDWLTKQTGQSIVAGAGTIVCWLIGFGWISRRFERQADTFAVQHLSQVFAEKSAEPINTTHQVTSEAMATMTEALGRVAALNHLPTRRRSALAWLFDWLPDSSVWRHGSIAWRQAYLLTLVGRPIDALPIDRQIRGIKLAAALFLAALIGLFASGLMR